MQCHLDRKKWQHFAGDGIGLNAQIRGILGSPAKLAAWSGQTHNENT